MGHLVTYLPLLCMAIWIAWAIASAVTTRFSSPQRGNCTEHRIRMARRNT